MANKLVNCPACRGFGVKTTFENNSSTTKICEKCGGLGDVWVPMTNADNIRSMSDEELAKYIVGNAEGEEYQKYEYEFSIENVRYFNVDYEHQGKTAEDSVLYWLQQPAEVGK